MEKTDLRIIRTKKMLCEALINLLEKNSYDKISVSDICEKAMVHRATFYNHFNDKDSLLDFILDNLQEELFTKGIKIVEENKILDEKEAYLKLVEQFINFGTENKEVLSSILRNSKDKMTSLIYVTLKRCLRYIISKNKYRNEYTLPINVMVTFLTGGIATIGIEWLESPNPPTKDEIMSYFDVIISPKVYIKNFKEN